MPETETTGAPNWRWLSVAMASSAVLFALAAPPRTALYWYIFPLFALGACYLVQYRAEFPLPWKVAFGISAVVSPVALALEWAFSGHVLWNVLFIGHAWLAGRRHSTWMVLLLASLVYLFAMKLAFQTTRDVVGGCIAIGLAAVMLVIIQLWQRPTSMSTGHRTPKVPIP